MGLEVVSDVAKLPMENASEGNSTFVHEKENGKVSQGPGVIQPIKFGSQGRDEQIKGQGNDVSEANLPKDAADEWPEPKQIHTFYFVRYRPYDDPKLKAKIDQADKEIQKKNQARFQITEGLKAKRSDRAQVISQLKSLTAEDKQYRMAMDEKRKDMEPLQQALGKLRNANNAGREKGFGLCSSEEELDDLIQSLNRRIQHESISLNEEKQIIREIHQLQGTREKVIANAAMRAKIQESLGQKEAIQDQVKLMVFDIDGVRKEQQGVRSKIKKLEEELKAIDNDISSLQDELSNVSQKRDKAYETFQELRKQRDEGNGYFYQNRALLNKARDFAAKKDLMALEELCHMEMEKFMSLWSSNKAFRDDYEKRILPSLDIRQLSRDGRMRNPDEKPLVPPVTPTHLETETVVKANVKPPKEDFKSPPKHDALPTQKAQKEANSAPPADSATTLEHADKEIMEKTSGFEKAQNNSSKDNAVDAAKLKEMKREEEIAKAKLALERKKKLAEKSAAKAAIRAQKEAEKKLKEREKKAKKKAAASVIASNPEEPTEPDVEVDEQENASVNTEAPVPSKNKDKKENSVRHRARPRGMDSRPKVIPRRKKATNYWVWAAPAALIVVLLLVLGYQYLL